MKLNLGIGVVAAFVAAGCASQLHRGVVAMKIDDTTAHVGLNQNEVSVGDHVQLYGNSCANAGRGQQKCKKVSKGHGQVTEKISDDYVAVQFDPGVTFKEGDYIEKHSH